MKRGIVHVEIPSADLAGSGKFYGALFGWKITAVPGTQYALWDADEGPAGGFNPLGDEVKVGEVLIYVDSADIEADLKQAAALGGSVVRPKTEIPGFGWFGLFRDPTGNVVGLYTGLGSQAGS